MLQSSKYPLLHTVKRVTQCWISYLWDFRCDGDSEQVHRHIHTSHHEDEQAMARVAVGAQTFLLAGHLEHCNSIIDPPDGFL